MTTIQFELADDADIELIRYQRKHNLTKPQAVSDIVTNYLLNGGSPDESDR